MVSLGEDKRGEKQDLGRNREFSLGSIQFENTLYIQENEKQEVGYISLNFQKEI